MLKIETYTQVKCLQANILTLRKSVSLSLPFVTSFVMFVAVTNSKKCYCVVCKNLNKTLNNLNKSVALRYSSSNFQQNNLVRCNKTMKTNKILRSSETMNRYHDLPKLVTCSEPKRTSVRIRVLPALVSFDRVISAWFVSVGRVVVVIVDNR